LFTGLVNVEQTDAESLLTAIYQFCVGKGIDIRRCRFIEFDGANVMSGGYISDNIACRKILLNKYLVSK